MTPLRAWYVGLPCRKCGQPVKQNDGGTFVYNPISGKPGAAKSWAECRTCREAKGWKGSDVAPGDGLYRDR